MAKPNPTKLTVTLRQARSVAVLLTAVASLVACATTAQRQAADVTPARARYLAYAGPPVSSFTWLGSYMGWEAVSDDELVLFLSPTRAYYLKVWSPCGDRGGLRWVYHIGLTKTTGTVYTRFDSVIADRWRCPISEIRPVDWGRMKADARAARKALPAAGAAPPPGGSPQPGGSPPPNPQ
ncbi:MAG: DUF6491 family protein [Steroidobacteraceae bacterium]